MGYENLGHPHPKPPPGKTFLLVVGILYAVFGALAALTNAAMLATAGFWDEFMPAANDLSWSVWYSFAVAFSLYRVLLGVFGILWRAKPRNASILTLLGGIDILLVLFSTVNIFFYYEFVMAAVTAFFMLVFGLALPILYIVGAQKNLGERR